MVKAVWAALDSGRRLYLVGDQYEFMPEVKAYVDYLSTVGRASTAESYRRHLKHYYTFLAQQGLDWRQVTPNDLVAFIHWLRNPQRQVGGVPLPEPHPLSEQTVNTIVAAVTSFYRYHIIIREEQVSNPVVYEQVSNRFSRFRSFLVHTSRGRATRRVQKLKVARRRPKTLTDEQFERFVGGITNPQFLCMVMLMRHGGLRVSEVIGLLIQDIEWQRCGVWIRRREGLVNKAHAKGMVEGEERFIDLDGVPQVMTLLDALVLHHTFATDHIFVVRKKDAADQWGTATYGRPLTRQAVSDLFTYYSAKAGFTKATGFAIHPHLLRHAHATELIEAGWDISYVQARLGHKSVQTTATTYIHLSLDALKRQWREHPQKKDNGRPTIE
jgi:integrase/recombinase XerD